MADIGDLLIRIDATTESLRRELKRAESATDQMAGRVDKSLAKVDGRFMAMAKTAAKAGAAIVASFGAVGGAKLIQVARETDVLDAQLKTATGSAEEAARAFQNLERFAAETPYALNEVVNAFVKLKVRGLDPSNDALRSYGNTAAALGKSLDQVIEAVADAATGDFVRLLEAFNIKARKSGDEVQLTFKGMTTTIRNSAEEITAYLRQIGDENFAGAMMERANSLDGALSNLGDSWDNLFRTIARGPIGVAIEDQVRQGSMALQRLADMVARLQGTATPEQQLRGELDDLFIQRQDLERRMNMRRRGGPPPELVAELERVKDLIQENLAKLKQLKTEGASTTAPITRQTIEEVVFKAPKKPKLGKAADAPYDGALGALERESQRIQDAFAEAEGFFSSTRTETEQLEAQIARVKELAAQGFFAAKGIDDQQILERLDAQLQDIGSKTETLTEFGVQAAQSMQAAFADYLFDPFQDGLDGMLDGFLKTVQRMLAEIAAQQVLTGIFSGMAGSTNPFFAGIGSQFGGARANGGPVAAGKSYLVGERGPEMFSPSVGGRISQTGGGVKVDIIDQRGASAPPVDVQRQMVGGMEQIRVMIRSEVGGMFADGTIDRQFRAASMPVRRTGRR